MKDVDSILIVAGCGRRVEIGGEMWKSLRGAGALADCGILSAQRGSLSCIPII
ncbi:MAG TPA: hypothetical protein VES66_11690 [Terriglobales bacterium]|nr:hypothetical protein [Terriglobales bacterium]